MKRSRFAVPEIGVALGAAYALVLACAPQDVVLVELERGDAGIGPGAPCTGDADCEASQFCAREACGSLAGVCSVRPAICENGFAPVCGCDGVNYWNDCLRRQGGVTSATAGTCARGLECGGRAPKSCPAGAFCGKLSPGPRCEPPDAPGVCWVLPIACPPQSDRAFEGCDPEKRCTNACEAIRSQRGFRGLPTSSCQ